MEKETIKKIGRGADEIAYIIFCICTLGLAVMLRVIMTTAIRRSR